LRQAYDYWQDQPGNYSKAPKTLVSALGRFPFPLVFFSFLYPKAEERKKNVEKKGTASAYWRLFRHLETITGMVV
jgi:hypothetical protein